MEKINGNLKKLHRNFEDFEIVLNKISIIFGRNDNEKSN